VVDVGEPMAVAEVDLPCGRVVNALGIDLVVYHRLRNVEIGVAFRETIAEPNLVVLDKRKYLLVRYRILRPYDDKLLAVFDELRHVFAEEGEGRVGGHHVCFFQHFHAFSRAEVAVAPELCQHVLVAAYQYVHVGHVHSPVAVHVGHFGNLNLVGAAGAGAVGLGGMKVVGVFEVVVGEERGSIQFLPRHGRAVVAGRHELPQPPSVEVEGEELEEVALVRVVAVAQHRLSPKELAIVFQLAGDVLQPGVELILFRYLSVV